MSHLRLAGMCLLAFIIAGCVSIPPPPRADVGVGISFDYFYSNLSPHGDWLVSGSYGRVWQPAVYRTGWSPYYDGHWIYTDVGWTWVSDYEWGAVPYHYGTWVLDVDLGWVWVPGYVWAPAWCVFRTGPDYIGWAPVPVGYSVGMSIGSASYSPDLFVFVASRDFLAPRVGAYAVPATTTRVIINNTRIENTIRIENNVVVNNGPDVRLVQRASGRRIEAESIERVPRVGPARHMTRADLRVDAAQTGTGLRAAEPISEKQSQAIIDRDRNDSRGPRAKDRRPQPTAPEAEGEQRSPGGLSPGGPQGQPDADTRQESADRERTRDRGREEPQARPQRRRTAEPEATPEETTPQKRSPRFSPSGDPQGQPGADTRQESADRERARDRGREEQQARPDRRRPRDEANDTGSVSAADAQAKADAKAKAEARQKARAKGEAQADSVR